VRGADDDRRGEQGATTDEAIEGATAERGVDGDRRLSGPVRDRRLLATDDPRLRGAGLRLGLPEGSRGARRLPTSG
jgi:hypothetical protein